MINTEDLKKITKLVLLSGYIKNVKPLSLMLISVAGNGKTEIISSFKSKRIIFMTDLTYMGLLKELKNNPRLKHIIIPDFIKITQKKRSTTDNLVSILNALVEEGIGKISMYNFECDYKNRNAGVIIATTKASFGQHKRMWGNMGFMSRMLLCSYEYKDETIERIFEYINNEDYLKDNTQEKIKECKDIYIKSQPNLNKRFNELAKKSFRGLKQLQTLAKCHALSRGSQTVTDEDIKEIIRLAEYLNLNFKKI